MKKENILDYSNFQKVKYAGFWIRVLASILDMIILSPLLFLSYYNNINIKSFFLLTILHFLINLYKPILEYGKGGTLGKLFLGIKVVNQHHDGISLEQSFIRSSPWLIIMIFSLYTSYILYENANFIDAQNLMEIGQLIVDTPLNDLSNLLNLILLISILKVPFSKTKQGIHDNLAKTYCVEN